MPLLFSLLLHVVICLLLFIHFTFDKPATLQPVAEQSINAHLVLPAKKLSSPTKKIEPIIKPVKEATPIIKENKSEVKEYAPEVKETKREVPEPKPEIKKSKAETQEPKPKVQEQKSEVKESTSDVKEIKSEESKPNVKEDKAETPAKKDTSRQEAVKEVKPKIKPSKSSVKVKQLDQQLLEEQIAAEQKQLKELKKTTQQKLRAIAEQQLQQQLHNEEAQLDAAATAAMQGEVDKYKVLILQAISQQWIVPENLPNDISCKLLIRLSSEGIVLQVKLITSSGSEVLDRSAIAAVYKASPLPVPNDTAAFANFRELYLTVKPEVRDGL